MNGVSELQTLGGRQPAVTIVVTTYNHACFLAEAIDSALAQTHPAALVIVVDDGSTDDPAAVSAHYQEVRFVRQSNQGLSAARNMGLHLAETPYVLFLDADDRLGPLHDVRRPADCRRRAGWHRTGRHWPDADGDDGYARDGR